MEDRQKVFFLIACFVAVVALTFFLLSSGPRSAKDIILSSYNKTKRVDSYKANIDFDVNVTSNTMDSYIFGKGKIYREKNESVVILNLTRDLRGHKRGISILNFSGETYTCGGSPEAPQDWGCTESKEITYTKRISNRMSLNNLLKEFKNYYNLMNITGKVIGDRKVDGRSCKEILLDFNHRNTTKLRKEYTFKPFFQAGKDMKMNSTVCVDKIYGFPLSYDLWIEEEYGEGNEKLTHMRARLGDFQTGLDLNENVFELPSEARNYEEVIE